MEWDRFKTEIDLRVYAASHRYFIDRKESWRGSAVMRHQNGDKIIVSRKPDGHYTYWSVRDATGRDKGTIIDFTINRRNLSLEAVWRELNSWLAVPPVGVPHFPELPRIAKDRAAVEERYASMRRAERNSFLEHERGIPPYVFRYWRFRGRIKIDGRANVAFPHFDTEGLCGYELRNRGFKGFARGGTKALWLSKTNSQDRRLIICESAIDAISFAVLFPDGFARYASTAGKLNGSQPDLIRAQIARLPRGGEVIAATDADEAGEQLAEAIRRAFDDAQGVTFRRLPPVGCKDWNDKLRERFSVLRARSDEPSVA